MIRRAIVFVLLSAAAGGAASAQQTTAAAPPPAGDHSDIVVMRVSGQPITETQVLQTMNQLASQQVLSANQGQKRKSALYDDAIENLVISALLKTRARLQSITIDKALIDRQMQAFAKQYSSEEDFQKALVKQGLTESELRKNIEESMAAQKVLDLAVKDVPGATEEELMLFYNNNPKKFDMPQRALASQILLRVDPKSTPEQKAEIKKYLEEIRARIDIKTLTFADAAQKYSQDPATSQKGGDVGVVVRDTEKSAEDSDQSIEKAIFETSPGSISPVIETPQGYRIFQVREIKPAGKESFEEAKPTIQKYLDTAARQKALQKFVQGLREKASIETFLTSDEFFQRHPAGSR
jgi:parvulin-like peptidyl-prolyl isomerase